MTALCARMRQLTSGYTIRCYPVVRHKNGAGVGHRHGIDCQKYREQRQSYRGHGCIVGDDRRSAAG